MGSIRIIDIVYQGFGALAIILSGWMILTYYGATKQWGAIIEFITAIIIAFGILFMGIGMTTFSSDKKITEIQNELKKQRKKIDKILEKVEAMESDSDRTNSN